MLTPRKKKNVMVEVAEHDKDTGSAPVQIAILTRRIEDLAAHLKKNAKDHHSRRGLLKMVSKRKKFLDYLASHNPKSYGSVIKKLGLKK